MKKKTDNNLEDIFEPDNFYSDEKIDSYINNADYTINKFEKIDNNLLKVFFSSFEGRSLYKVSNTDGTS